MDDVALSKLDTLRLAVRTALAERGCDVAELEETILIRGGMYCGRRFTCPGGSAVWFVEENQVKYYDAEGQVTATEPQRRAA
jgi:hypothetical protein